jgi:CLASP N terminal
MESSSERYTTYEDLLQSVQDIKETTVLLFSDNWEENFHSITHLRSCVKYNWEEFQHYWEYIRPRILQLASSLRSTLAKNALILISEILKFPRENFEISEILNMLLNKSAIEKSFIKSEIITGIENACNNYPSLVNSEILLCHSFSKSNNISKISLKYLDIMLTKLALDEKFNILAKLNQGKRYEHNIIAKKILLDLESNWNELPGQLETLDPKIKTWIATLANKPQPVVSLKDMIKCKKETLATE